MINVNKINQQTGYGAPRPDVKTQYSAIAKPYTKQGTGDMGKLIPISFEELLPSEKMHIDHTIAIQFMPFVTNLFQQLDGEIASYFVPFRLIWDDWEKFITGGIDGQDNTAHPTIDLKAMKTANAGSLRGTLCDELGLPINSLDDNMLSEDTLPISAMYHMAYNRIYNDHIRNLDLEPNEVDPLNNILLKSNNNWDYFTRSRIFQQRGIAPSIPINDDLLQLSHSFISRDYIWEGNNDTKNSTIAPISAWGNLYSDDYAFTITNPINPNELHLRPDLINPHNLSALGVNINDFIIGLDIMRYQVNNSRIQPKYIDQLYMRYKILPQDARLQRAEYLGTNYFTVQTDTVTQTSAGGENTTHLGHMQGQAFAGANGLSVNYEAKEHGILMSIMVIKPKRSYEGGLNRKFIKYDKFSYATPELANTPDREVYRGELYFTGIPDNDKVIFGWQGIYEEYRTNLNLVTGRLRPSENTNLVSYTLAEYWNSSNLPVLNEQFIQCSPDTDRIMVFTTEPNFLYFVRNNIKTAIPLPYQSDPGVLPFL